MNLRQIGIAVVFVASTAIAQESPKPEPAGEARMNEVIVVTASRTEQRIDEVPAAVTVITSEEIEKLPVHDYGDILRSVPGVNVTQMSAREMQVTARSATSSLATSQLVLLDRRSVYLDFFGFVMWDFLPVDLAEIKQVEVVRGPASAVWGANAMTGVVNLITKAPREMAGTSVTVGAGEFGTFFSNLTHAGARDRYGYKITAGYYEQDPFERPVGLIPGTRTPYPAFENEGTRQPKADLRVDYDVSPRSVLSLSGGYAGTDGLVHTGIGPFDLKTGSSMSYAKADWTRGALQATAFVNVLDADSTNLLAIGADGKPIAFAFETKTYNLDVTNTTVLRSRHVLTYGATARQNDFGLSIAPRGEQRKEYGGFLQDEVLLGKARWVVGARWDDMDPIGSVISPRTALLYSPAQDHTVRISFSRAFRAPSVINTDLDTAILNEIALPTGPYVFGTRAVGNTDLTEERMDAYEIGYVGRLRGHATLAVSVYRNETKDVIDFYASSYYTGANPPAMWPLPPFYLEAPPLRNALPSSFSYRNIGSVTNSGVEVALNARPSTDWSWFVNYSWAADPEAEGVDVNEINAPPSDRVNAGAAWDHGRFFLNTTVHYQSRAEWRDVLDARYWGPTDSFTSVNAGAGVRVTDNITVSLKGTNLTNERIQQHVFGDILSRKVIAQLRFSYP